jgi:hypothetical protein
MVANGMLHHFIAVYMILNNVLSYIYTYMFYLSSCWSYSIG